MTQNCSLCDKVFVTKEALDEHLLNHQEKKTVVRRRGRPGSKIACECSECNEVFFRRCDLRLHRRIMHQPNKVVCTVCSRSFSNEGRLKMHYQHHNVGGGYECVYCSREFNKGWKLKIHVVNHSGKAPYICLYCKEDFLYPGKIVDHLKREHDIFLACRDCGLGFRTSIEQENHICKLFDCKDCNMSFCTSKELSSHVESHKVKSENFPVEKEPSQTNHDSMIFTANEMLLASFSNSDVIPSLCATNKASTLPDSLGKSKIDPCSESEFPVCVQLERENATCTESKTPQCAQGENQNYPYEKNKSLVCIQLETDNDFCEENKMLPSTPMESKNISCAEVQNKNTVCKGNKIPPQTQFESRNNLHKSSKTVPFLMVENEDGHYKPPLLIVQMSATTKPDTIKGNVPSKVIAKKLSFVSPQCNESVKSKLNEQALSMVNVSSKNTIDELSTPKSGTGFDISCTIEPDSCFNKPVASKKSVIDVPSNSFPKTEGLESKVCRFKVAKPGLVSSRRHFINILKKNPVNSKVNQEQASPNAKPEQTSLELWLTSDGSCVTSDFVFGLETKGSERSLDSPCKVYKIEKERYDMTFEDLCQF
ncbi:zinc finger protein 85-like [Macrobrachium nipponense]|uniref:zinc finger protein 85-like n=1 Tax=Macrobrachium nipponense TaxID=159736 RepID=UPI0030C85BD0